MMETGNTQLQMCLVKASSANNKYIRNNGQMELLKASLDLWSLSYRKWLGNSVLMKLELDS